MLLQDGVVKVLGGPQDLFLSNVSSGVLGNVDDGIKVPPGVEGMAFVFQFEFRQPVVLILFKVKCNGFDGVEPRVGLLVF